MKRFLKVMVSTLFVSLMGNTFGQVLDCPSSDEIRKATFLKASNWGSGDWIVVSEPFHLEKNTWIVLIETGYSQMKTSEEALQHSQKLMSTLPLHEIKKSEKNGATECTYTDEHAHFYVGALGSANGVPFLTKFRR